MALNSFSKFLCGAGCVTAPNVFLALNSYNSSLSKSLEAEEKIKEQGKKEAMAKEIMKLKEEIKEKDLDIESYKEQAETARLMVGFFNKPTKVVLSNGITCVAQPSQTSVSLQLCAGRECKPSEDFELAK